MNDQAETLARALWPQARRAGEDGWLTRCPAHDDHEPSLSVSLATSREAPLVYCFAGCEFEAVVAAIRARGIEWPDRREGRTGTAIPRRSRASPAPQSTWAGPGKRVPGPRRLHCGPKLGTPVAVWAYHDERERVVCLVARYELPAEQGKTYVPWSRWWRVGEASPAWCPRAPPAPRPLYRLPEWGPRALVLEGERTVEHARSGFADWWCTCWMSGAEAWRHTDLEPLRRAHEVAILPDGDRAGRKAARQLRTELAGGPERIEVVDVARDWPPEASEPWPRPRGWDLADGPPPERIRRWRETLPHGHILRRRTNGR